MRHVQLTIRWPSPVYARTNVDAAYGMTATLRSNGEYVVLTENAGGNHIIMMRWRPSP